MLLIAVLTCLEAQSIIYNVTQSDMPIEIKTELIREINERSECTHGNV